jgi:hypothetical protein
MYFIARNNAIYSYIAHTSLRRCYLATLFTVGAFFVIGTYFVYYPLLAHITLLKSEHVALQKKYDEIAQLDKSGQELAIVIEAGKKKIVESAIMPDKRAEECHKRMLFVLDAVAKSGLTLNAYGSCKEKNKEWYIKSSSHFDVAGSMQKIMAFLETIKNSRSMITVSHVAITRLADDAFQMGCDVGVITVNK